MFRYEWIDSINGVCKVLVQRGCDEIAYIINIDSLIDSFKNKDDNVYIDMFVEEE